MVKREISEVKTINTITNEHNAINNKSFSQF